MWEISENEIIRKYRSNGDGFFAALVNKIIVSHCSRAGIPRSEIDTTVRETVPDGGVDAQVNKPSSITGDAWMSEKTCWQYKSSPFSKITAKVIVDEINKAHSKQLIQEGFAYRLCVCDSFPTSEKKSRKDALIETVRGINPDAPQPMILCADDLARWGSDFPAIICDFKPFLLNSFNLFKWGEEITSKAKTYVSIPEWEGIHKRIESHVDFAKETHSVVLDIQGAAGVGKTRLVYETLADKDKTLVVYTENISDALTIAHAIAFNDNLHAILVADECGPEGKARLESKLSPYQNRVRVVTIDNSGEYARLGTPEIWLKEEDTKVTVLKILQINFSEISPDSLNLYAGLADGFIRLALFLCRDHAEIVSSGIFKTRLGDLRNYIELVLKRVDQGKRALMALSLFKRVGYQGDPSQLKILCECVGLNEKEMIGTARKLKDNPGFMTITGGGYFYVTPEIVANILFEYAWHEWIELDPKKFIDSLPDEMQQSFENRAKLSYNPEIKEKISGFFQEWFLRLTPESLRDLQTVKRIVRLVEIDPEFYLPALKGLFEDSTKENLLQVSGEWPYGGQWGPRRALVCLAERLAIFPEYFKYAEGILLKLAISEEETGIANNATAIWKQLFRVALSGSSLPFGERLMVLRSRILSGNNDTLELSFRALDGVFARHLFKTAVEPIVTGRITPGEWRPSDQKEYGKCLIQGIDLLIEMADIENEKFRLGTIEVLTKNMPFILELGQLHKIKELVSKLNVGEESLPKIIQSVESFLWLESRGKKGKRVPDKYIDDIKAWLSDLAPKDFHARLMNLITIDPWHFTRMDDESVLRVEVETVGKQLCEDQEILFSELPAINAGNSQTALELGREVGKNDAEAYHVEKIFNSAVSSGAVSFARGYVIGVLEHHSDNIGIVNSEIDKIEGIAPKIAFELFHAGGDSTNAVERALRLVDAGTVEPELLGYFSYGLMNKQLSIENFRQILKRLVPFAEKGDLNVIRIALSFISRRLRKDDESVNSDVVEQGDIQEMMWKICESAAVSGTDQWYEWRRIVLVLSERSPEKAAFIASIALIKEGMRAEYSESQKVLLKISEQAPDIVMKELGEVMLHDKFGVFFYIHSFKELFAALPYDIVKSWVEMNGVKAAQLIARHLPDPYIDENGRPAVPPLTKIVLEIYGDDKRTFMEFCAGYGSFKMMSGDIAAEHDAEAEFARKFIDHSIKAIREWAKIEILTSEEDAKQWRIYQEEERFRE
jgi:hypothetical protein